ncbi:MAG: hypothetical protein LBD71_00170 [Treponema sp.]|jgi:hypothetical protein|nr:hypothetical protein [Treponema sp.]
MSRSSSVSSIFFIQLALGVYFAVLGVEGIAYKTATLHLTNSQVLNLVIAVVYLVAGVFLIIGLLAPIDRNLYFILNIIVFIVWAIYIVLSLFINDNFLKPTLLSWLGQVSWRSVILASLWLVGRKAG